MWKDYICNPSTCSCKNASYLASIMDDLAITCDEVIEWYDKETKTIPTIFNEKKSICKIQKFLYFTCIFLITIALLITVSIYYYLIKNRAKEKHLLPFHDTNKELREVLY